MQTIQALTAHIAGYYGLTDTDDIIRRWQEPHRFYHTAEHLKSLCQEFSNHDNEEERRILYCAALFHDIVYIPGAQDNEEQSVEIVKRYIPDSHPHFDTVCDIIIDTKHHTPRTSLSAKFCDADMAIVTRSSLTELLEWDKKIFLEFQKYDYDIYRERRLDFLEKAKKRYPTNAKNLTALQEIVRNNTPKIGVYAGSFNPFHNGHLNILHKAEKIFDKVIIAQGINPEKLSQDNDNIHNVKAVAMRQCERFTGLLTDFVLSKSQHANITIIRGLRNGDDLAYEANQLRFMEYLKPDIQIMFLLCDMEYEHISSSSLRNLEKIQKGLSLPYIPF
ncbi:MAG: adenylyltransferase/cytidyltransferase family protein [Candidatus Kapaibacterium sp.]|jgi:pantetheine-phosphate adenylyltransferase